MTPYQFRSEGLRLPSARHSFHRSFGPDVLVVKRGGRICNDPAQLSLVSHGLRYSITLGYIGLKVN